MIARLKTWLNVLTFSSRHHLAHPVFSSFVVLISMHPRKLAFSGSHLVCTARPIGSGKSDQAETLDAGHILHCETRRTHMGARADSRIAQTDLAIYRDGMIVSHVISGKS